MPTLADRLRKALPELSVRTAPASALDVDDRRALALAEPADEAQLSAVVGLAAEAGLGLHVRGSGGQEQMAEACAGVDLVLSLAGLRGVTDYAPEDLTVGAWAGTTLAELGRELERHGQRLPAPPLAAHATLGGLVATGRSGPFRLGHRTPRDSVLGLGLCLADGTLARTGGRVVKNVAGYDLTRLMVGSLGTLAVVTKVFIRVAPRPSAEATVWRPCPDAASARALGVGWQGQGLEPTALEYLDAAAAQFAGLDPACGLLAAFEDEPAAVRAQVAEALAASPQTAAARARELAPETAERVWRALHAGPAEAALLVRVSTPPAALPEIWRTAEASRSRSGGPPLAGRAGVAVGVGHLWGGAGNTDADTAFVAALRSAAEALGGAVVLERAPVALRRAVGAFGRPPAAVERMRALKAALDPAGILEPGRMAGIP